MKRKMTEEEKIRLKDYFPRLDVNRAMVTGEATQKYCCISWTVDVTDRWLWPGPLISDFDRFYGLFGFVRAQGGPIAVWGESLSSMTHGSISGAGHGPRWESKCGADLRIQHGFDELEGEWYGGVIAFYRKRGSLADDPVVETADLFKSGIKDPNEMKLDKTRKDMLVDEIKKIDDNLHNEFKTKFSRWVKTWNAPQTAHLSDPSFVRHNNEFADLVALGEAIIPLVIEKLTDPDNFFALQLYEALKPDSDAAALRSSDEEEELILEGEQGRAVRTVEEWLRNRRQGG